MKRLDSNVDTQQAFPSTSPLVGTSILTFLQSEQDVTMGNTEQVLGSVLGVAKSVITKGQPSQVRADPDIRYDSNTENDPRSLHLIFSPTCPMFMSQLILKRLLRPAQY